MTVKNPAPAPIGDVVFFDPDAYKASIQEEVPDAVVRYLGNFQFYSPGAALFHEVCTKRGLVDKARKALVGWVAKENQIVFVPTSLDDKKALTITWSARQTSGRMRLRSVFRHYGIEMLKNTAWQLTATVKNLPGIGWALVVDLDEALQVVEIQKRVAAAQQTE